MFARAHASHPGTTALPAGFGFIRYLDVCLVIAGAPLVLLAGMPRLGYAVGAAGWIATRFAVEILKRRAWKAETLGARIALHLASILGRVWLIVVVILAARFGGSNADGIAAAVVVLAAFTVELAMSFVLRPTHLPRSGA